MCLGKHRTQYHRIVDLGEVLVTGMPDGVQFKRPGAYGIDDLKSILAAESQIMFMGKFALYT